MVTGLSSDDGREGRCLVLLYLVQIQPLKIHYIRKILERLNERIDPVDV